MRGLVVCVCFAASCGRIGFDSSNDGAIGVGDGSAGACAGPASTSFVGPFPAALTPFGEPPGMVRANNGLLEVSIDGTFDTSAGLRTSLTSLVDRSIAVEVIEIIDSDSIGATLLGVSDTSGSAHLVVYSQSDQFRVERIVEPLDFQFVAEEPLDLDMQRWWRMGATATALLVDASADGTTWNHVATVPSFFDLSQVVIEIGAGSFDTNIPPDTARFGAVLDCR